jgi:hypothetical protein
MIAGVHYCARRILLVTFQYFTTTMLVLGAGAGSAGKFTERGRATFTDSITIKICQVKKNLQTRLYLDAAGEVIYFSSTGRNEKAYQIYLFNMDGRLATLAKVGYKQTTLLPQLQKGNYMFEVFSNDDRIENGSITIR